MVEANKMKSKTNEGPLVRSKSNEGPLVQSRSSEVPLVQTRLSSQSTASVKASKRASLGQLRRPSVAKTNNKIDLKKTNSYVNSLYKAPPTKAAATKDGYHQVLEKPTIAGASKDETDEILEKHGANKDGTGEFLENETDRFQLVNALEVLEKPTIPAATKDETDEILEKHTAAGANRDGTGEFLENATDRFQLVNALEAILAHPSINLNSHTDQTNIKDEYLKSDVKAKNDPSKFEEEIKSKHLKSVNDSMKTISKHDKSSSTSRASPSDAKTEIAPKSKSAKASKASPSDAKTEIAPKSKSTKASKALQTLNSRKPSARSKLIEPTLNPLIHVKPIIPSTDEVLAVSKISGPRNSTGSLIRSSKCPIKPNRVSLSPKKSSSVNRPTKLSTLPKSSSTKHIRTSTPKDSGSAKSTRSPSVSPREDSSGSTPLLKNSVSIRKSGLHTVPKNGSIENLNSKIMTSNKTVSMPNLCNIQLTDDVKNRSNSTKKPNVGEPKVMEIIEQKFGLKLEGVTARNKLVIAKIVEQVEGIEHSLKLTNKAKEDELQKERDELQRQRMANEQLKKNNELLENCQHKIKETMADREEEMMREMITKNKQIEELKIFSMKNTDFLNDKLLLKDEDAMELNEHVEKLKIILNEKDNLLQEVFDQQAVYQDKIKQYENSDKLKDELMNDMMANHKNEIEALGLKISDKDRIAKDLKLKVSKLIAEFTKEFKEKDEEIKMRNEQLKYKTKEASYAIAQQKLLQDDLVKIKKVLSDKIKDLEIGKTLNYEHATVIENLNQQLNNFINERNQQSIVIDNLMKDISDFKKEYIKMEHVKSTSNPDDPVAPVQEKPDCANISDIIKGDNPKVSAQTNIKFEKNLELFIYEPNLQQTMTESSEDSEMEVKQLEFNFQARFNMRKEENNEIKQTLEPSEDKIAEVPADESFNQMNQTDMETKTVVKMDQTLRGVEQMEFKTQAGFDMSMEGNNEFGQIFEPSKDITVQVQEDESLNQIHQTDMEPKIDVNMIETYGDVEQLELESEESFVMLMEENNEIKHTFEPSKGRIVVVQTYEGLNQMNQTDVETNLDLNMIQTSGDIEQLESNSQAGIDMKLMDENIEKKQTIETIKDIIVEVQTNESLNQIYQTDLSNFQRKLSPTSDDVKQLENNTTGGFDLKLKEKNVEIKQTGELSNDAIVKVHMDESSKQTNVKTELDFKANQSSSDFEHAESNNQARFDMELKEENNRIFDARKDTLVVAHADESLNQINQTDVETKLIQTAVVESLESNTQAGFDMKLKEKNRKIIIQTFEPIQDIITEVSKHINYEHGPEVEAFSTLNENDGFNEGSETVTSLTKNWQLPLAFQNSCDPSSYSLADFDVSLNILENKRSLKKKRKEFSPFCDTKHREEVIKEYSYTQDDFVEHVLNLDSSEEGRTGVVKSLIRDFEELATDSKEETGGGASALKK